MPEVGSPLTLDIGPALASLDKLTTANLGLVTAVNQGQTAMQQSAAEVARQATAYSNALARQQDEVRNASAAVASAREELKRLTDQQKELTAAQSKTNSTTAEYQRLTRELEKNKQAVTQVKAAIAESKQAVLEERDAVVQVREARRQETNATRETAAAAKDAAAQVKQEAAAQREAAGAASTTTGAAGGLSGALSKIGSVLGGLAVISFAKRLGSEVLEVTSDFQRMEAVLTTIFDGDSAKAQRVFAQLRQFTLRNPFEVASVTESYVKLRNVGINPSIQQFQQLADLAAASGKDIGAATDTLLGASTGRVAQLRQLGIVAKVSGDTVTATFRGQTTVIQNNQQAIADYVLGLGALNGVVGATARIMGTTGGQVTNLKDTFTELFNAIGEGTGGPVSAFIRGLTEITKGVTNFLKSDKQKISEAAAGPVQIYEDSIDQLFQAAVERAKKNGTSAGDAVAAVVKGQQAKLAQQLAEAQKQVAFFTLDGSKDASLRQGSYRGGAEQFKADGIQAKAYLEYVQAGQKALQDRADVALKGSISEESALGRIERLRAKIAADTEKRDKTANTDQGNAERVRLNALLQDENKLLNELLGKEEKLRKGRTYNYESQLRALLQERQTLTSLAAKAGEQLATDAAARAKLVFDEGLRQVDVIEAKLKQRELDLRKAAEKVGGGAVSRLGSLADGVIDGTQERELGKLRVAALDAYYAELGKIEREREQRLFGLRADSAAKEVEAVDRKYDKLIEAAKDNIERQALEEARAREQVALRAQQEDARIAQAKELAQINAGITGLGGGRGTGKSVYEAKLDEQQQLLDAEKKAAQDSLNNTLNKVGMQAEIERAAAREQLGIIAKHQADLDALRKKTDFSIAKLLLGDDDDGPDGAKRQKVQQALDATVGQVINSLNEIVAAEEQAAQARAQVATQNINELTGSLAAQIALNREGSASNIAGLQKEISDQKALRAQALDDQRTAAKEKVLIDSITQASAIATSAAQIIEGFSLIPVIGPALGIAAASLVIGAFVASKVQAYQAAGSIGQGSFFVGGYTGDGDERQTSTAVGPRPYEYHRREFVMPHDLTDKYRFSLFEPLHEGRPQDIDWPAIMPDLGLPNKMAAEKASFMRVQHEHTFAPMQAGLDKLHDCLSAIEGSNQLMADQPTITPFANGYMMRWPNGSEKFVRPA